MYNSVQEIEENTEFGIHEFYPQNKQKKSFNRFQNTDLNQGHP